MIKKFILTLLIGAVAFTSIGCSNKDTKEAENNNKPMVEKTAENEAAPFELNELGFSFMMPTNWDQNENIDGLILSETGDPNDPLYGGLKTFFIPKENLEKIQSITKDGKQPSEEEMKELFNAEKPLADFNIYKKEMIKGKSIEEFSKLRNNILLGENEGLVYYLSYANKEDIQGLSNESQKLFDALYTEIPNIKDTVKIFKPVFPEDTLKSHKSFPVFKSKDINGKDVSSELFKENKLTMINVWGTFCGPCISEIPDLQKLYEDVKKDNINIVGLIGDAEGNEDLAKEILSKKGATYVNIIPDKVIIDQFLKDVAAYPTSIFVDSEGNIIGEPVVGSRSEKEYKEIIMMTLKKLEK